MLNYAQELLQKFDYAHLLLADGSAAAEKYQPNNCSYIRQLNA